MTAALKAEIDRLIFALSDARMEIALLLNTREELVTALGDLCDDDVSYHGAEIHIPCVTHGDAIRRIREARAALEKARRP